MIAALQLWLAPAAAVLLTLWAGVIGLAGEGDPDLPRAVTTPLGDGAAEISVPRGLHIVHLALLVVAAALASAAVGWWLWPAGTALARLVPTILLVWVLGDLLPRVVATLLPSELLDPVRRAAARSLLLFRPLLRALAWADRPGDGLADRPDRGQRAMLAGVFSLGEMTVAEVMTPRIDVVAVDRADDLTTVLTTFRTAGYARLLVFDGHPDAVAGALYAKDLLNALRAEQDLDWRTLVRPVAFVPEAKTLDRQLRDFQHGPSHLMVVVDEFGGTAGLVTLEDILEQIVGEIHDEHDVDEVEPILRDDNGGLRVQGGVPLSELEARVGRRFGRDDVDTVGGLVLAALGRVPRVGDEVVADNGVRLHVDLVVRRRVKRVTVTLEEHDA